MSLLSLAMTPCVMMDKTTRPDGEGGIITSWVDGAEFEAAIVFDNSMEAKIAEKQGVTSLYTITTTKDIIFRYHDVFRRLDDGKIFRVTSDGDDKYTPSVATLNMRQVSAEEYEMQ